MAKIRPDACWLACALTATAFAPAQSQTATETVLHSFGSPPKGAEPFAGVIRDSAGNLYGTTAYGGAANQGVVYRVDTAGHLNVLYSFTGGADGGRPYAGVIADSAGDLYGTTFYGGTANAGVVFKLDSSGNEKVLYSFTGGADGAYPYAGVIRDSAGNLYGTTLYGGAANTGAVFKLDTSGQETVLYSFLVSGTTGAEPFAGAIRDSAGDLYGTTYYGGTANQGVVYKLDAPGQETVLYSFTGGTDGGEPYAGVVRDSAGNLYGTASIGGTTQYGGVVYKLDTTGHQTVLYNFTIGPDGGGPEAGVIRDEAGNIYGTTGGGGTASDGVVYKLDPSGNETVLYTFTGGAGGSYPNAGVIRDSAGTLYGAAIGGGPANAGVVFKLDTAGNDTVLYTFPGSVDGSYPQAGVVRDSSGNLYGTYGTTFEGGVVNKGVVYKLDSAGHQTVLHTFTGPDGQNPNAGVIRDSAGNLYGTTFSGGAGYGISPTFGVVYKLSASGQLTVLHSFTGPDGSNPQAGVIRDSAGNLYGTTYQGGASNAGVVFKLDPSGQETVLYSFTNGHDGAFPEAGVIRDAAGNLYGTTHQGGSSLNWGVVYKVDATGHETVLHDFISRLDGRFPVAGLIRDSAGNLYGTARQGGTSNAGIVFKLDTAGQETILYNFTGGADGGHAEAGVVLDSAGNLYGTTYSGGKESTGVVFKLTP